MKFVVNNGKQDLEDTRKLQEFEKLSTTREQPYSYVVKRKRRKKYNIKKRPFSSTLLANQ